ncbi:MAG: hypothetical protein LC778_20940 [Acidobacteria bacterium]|nr:hypothetical protein [Acidobacteriota bacterium]
MEVVIGLDMERDRAEMERLGLETFSAAHMDSVLIPRYEDAGFKVLETDALPSSEWSRLQTSWAKRLQGNANRTLFYIVARAPEVEK